MIRRIVLSVLVPIFMISLTAWAQDVPTGERGPGREHYRPGLVAGGVYDDKTADLERRLYRKRVELIALLAAPEVDGEKAAALHREMVEAMGRLADRRFEMAMDYKKKNPSWQPGFGRMGAWEGGSPDPTGLWSQILTP